MGYRSKKIVPPIKDCSHSYSMHYTDTRCWCDVCGQSWKMLYHQSGDPKGWYPLPLHEMAYGDRIDRW